MQNLTKILMIIAGLILIGLTLSAYFSLTEKPDKIIIKGSVIDSLNEENYLNKWYEKIPNY